MQTLETQSGQSEPAKEEQNTRPLAFCGISAEAEKQYKYFLANGCGKDRES